MKEYTTDQIRNICLAGQRGCGKTSLVDAIAYNTKINNRIGRVDDGSSLLDYNEDEISRKTTLSAKLLACEWQSQKLNIIDCPGHSDFIGELQSAMHVTEIVGILVTALSGVEVGTILHWNEVAKRNKPRFFFVNKMGVENVKWRNSLDSIKKAFGKQAVAVQLPMGEAENFKGMIDLLHMKAYNFDGEGGRNEIPIPDEFKDEALAERDHLIEVAAEADDALLEKYFEDGTLDDADVLKGLQAGIINAKVFPVLFGSGNKNIGVRVLLDFLAEYAPSPIQVPPVQATKTGKEDIIELKNDVSGSTAAFVYKVVAEGHLGDMSYVRCFSGNIKPSMDLKNQQKNTTERIGHLYTFQGKNRIEIQSIPAGDIGVLVKLKDSHIGNTLADASFSVSLPQVTFTNPVMDVAVKAAKKGEEDKIAGGFHKLNEEDPTFKLVAFPALKQQVLYGQGPTHIDILVSKLKTRFGVDVELVKPKIPYRETIKGSSEKQYKHKKQSGGRGQYGDVHLKLEPNNRGDGFEFIDAIKGGVIPSKFIPAVEKGVQEAMVNGSLTGSEVVDVKATLFFGSYHDVDSSDMAFKIAGMMAFRECFMDSKPIILEPIYNIEITVPDEFTGDVMGDMSARRGKISGMTPDGHNQIIKAQVPQAELYQYSVDLRSMTQGQGIYTLSLSHYEEVPHDAAQKVIEEAKRDKEDEE